MIMVVMLCIKAISVDVCIFKNQVNGFEKDMRLYCAPELLLCHENYGRKGESATSFY